MFKQLSLAFNNKKNSSFILNFDIIKFYLTLAYLIFNFSYVSIIGELTFLVSIFNYLFYSIFLCIFIYELFSKKYDIDVFNTILILFIISTFVTMYLNSYTLSHYINEIKFIILGIFQFFIFFNILNKNSYLKLKILSEVILSICLISHVFSIIIYIFKIRIVLNKVYGIHFNGSFTGIYDNENILGIICFIGIVFSFIFLNYFKGVIFKQIAVINIVLSVIMLFLVNARSAVIAFLVFCFVFTAITFKNKWIMFSSVSALGLVSSYLIFFNKEALIKLLNGRYEIWEQVIHIIKHKLLFGYSKTDSINSLINSTIRFLSGAKEGGTHNTFLDVLLSYGIIAFVLIICFLVIYLIKTYKILMKNLNNYNYIVIYSAVLSLLFVGMFESVLIYTPSLIGIIFWMILGYIRTDHSVKNQ